MLPMMRWFHVSRPRFWFYLFGPFILGLVGSERLLQIHMWSKQELFTCGLATLFFLWPANFFVYGVNDLFDYETDRLNPKKQGYEQLLSPSDRRPFLYMLVLALIPALFLFVVAPPLVARLLALFLLLSLGYSVPPLRAKARPFLDTVFNSLYVMPGLIGYALCTSQLPPFPLIGAGIVWCMAMHAYSAIPDQEVDRTAHIETIATVLGTKKTLVWCIGCFVVAALLTIPWLQVFAIMLLLPYLFLLGQSFSAKKPTDIHRWYQWFPRVNGVVGFLLTLVILFT